MIGSTCCGACPLEPASNAVVTPVPISDPLVAQLEVARETLSSLQKRLTREHPDVIEQRQVVIDLEKALSARPDPTAEQGRPAAPAAPPPDETDVTDRADCRERG